MKCTRDKITKKLILFASVLCILGICGLINTKQVRANKITISHTSLTMQKNTAKKLKVYNLPSAKAKVVWSTSNKYAVSVSKKGKVKALNYGTTTITAKYKKQRFTCVINVPDTSRSITLNAYSLTMSEGTICPLTAASVRPVRYHSGNEAIATVDANGIITAQNPGIVAITAKSSRGVAVCTVTVTSNDVDEVSPEWITDRNITAIRRLTKNNNIVYDNITWAKGKTITFKIDNLDESNVKRCVWNVDDRTIVSKPSADSSKIKASAQTLKEGTTKITATVTDYQGNVRIYSNDVYISAPVINTRELILLGSSAGSNRQQFIKFSGLSKYSKIKWSNSNYLSATYSEYKTKAAVWGINSGIGIITASVDGKSYKINYKVLYPVVGKIPAVLAVNRMTKINISGIDGIVPYYSSRNKTIATVMPDGTITVKKSGVTYIDVRMNNMVFSYRVEVAAKGIRTIIKRANYIVNNWKYSQGRRMKKGYYDCSSLVWKGYRAYKKYNKKLGSSGWALPAGELFDYLYEKKQIKYFGYTCMNDLKPGDLIFYGDYGNAVRYSTPGRTLDIYHVAMYAGAGQVVEKGGQTLSYNGTKYIVGIGRVVK